VILPSSPQIEHPGAGRSGELVPHSGRYMPRYEWLCDVMRVQLKGLIEQALLAERDRYLDSATTSMLCAPASIIATASQTA
jgi:hypothetical protein